MGWTEIIRGLAVIFAVGLAMSMAVLARFYHRHRDGRRWLAFGYALAMAYVAAVQLEAWNAALSWRTWLGLSSSMVGWYAVLKYFVHGRSTE